MKMSDASLKAAEADALEVHLIAVLRSLEEFHAFSFEAARNAVSRFRDSEPDLILHSEPYILAFEIAHGGDRLSTEDYQRDRPRALEIYDRAQKEHLAVRSAVEAAAIQSIRDELKSIQQQLSQVRPTSGGDVSGTTAKKGGKVLWGSKGTKKSAGSSIQTITAHQVAASELTKAADELSAAAKVRLLVSEGRTAKEIAEALNVSLETIQKSAFSFSKAAKATTGPRAP